MKIMMVDPSLFTGRYDDSLCTALAGQGHEVRLMGRPLRRTDAPLDASFSYSARFFKLSERLRPMLGDGAAFKAAKGADYLCDSYLGPLGVMSDADIVHMQWMPLARADARWIDRLRALPHRPALVHTVHNATAYHGDAAEQGRGYAKLLRRFDSLIVHGPETRDALLAQGVAGDLIFTVPHPPMRLAQADPATLAHVPTPNRPRALFFGTLRPYKGVDLLIEACLNLWRQGADFELAIAGKPFMDVEPLLDQVRHAGFADRLVLDLDFLKEQQLDAHLQKADMIVFPYRHIDSSGAFLSALHYGKPMICTRVGMFANLPKVVDGADAVSLCRPDDAGALGEAIHALLANPALHAQMGRKAADLLDVIANWDDAARLTTQAYAAALDRTKNG